MNTEQTSENISTDLSHWKCWNKVRLGTYSIEKVKISYGWEFISLEKPKKKVRLEIFSIEKAKIR